MLAIFYIILFCDHRNECKLEQTLSSYIHMHQTAITECHDICASLGWSLKEESRAYNFVNSKSFHKNAQQTL